MVHNGIEYAMMQMISEVYDVLQRGARLTNEELQQVFSAWNKGQLQSFLIHITADIFKTKDEETDKFLIDVILDQAGSKGTGKWTSQEAMNIPVSIPSIDAAVAARTLSVYKEERRKAASLYKPGIGALNLSKEELIPNLENALAFCFVIAYAQGLNMLARASEELKMEIPLPSVIQVWKAGCIIRSALLGNFTEAYNKDPNLVNLLADESIAELLKAREASLRQIVTHAINAKIPLPAMTSALSYFDGYCSERLPTNLIQAQRDFFGAHTYQRIDKPGVFHTEWHSS
jgi:6-phosphogluconate dehydrogenase